MTPPTIAPTGVLDEGVGVGEQHVVVEALGEVELEELWVAATYVMRPYPSIVGDNPDNGSVSVAVKMDKAVPQI